MSTTPTHTPHTPWARVAVIGVVLTAAVSILVLAFLWPAATASAKHLPIAIAGETAQVTAVKDALNDKSPGTFAVTAVDDRAAAVTRIKERKEYGAIVLGTSPEILTASAANPSVAQVLDALQPALQAQVNAAASAAAPAHGVTPTTPIVVKVTDVVPLASTDPRGTVLASSSFPLVLGGMVGGLLISFAVIGVWRRVTALFVYSILGGLAITAVLQNLFGGLHGDFTVNTAVVALTLLGIGGVITGLVSIIGRAGAAAGPVIFLLIANPISAAAIPIEFIAKPWGAVGQWFPPGAAATLLRELSYFPQASTLFPWLVLVGWAAAGIILSAVGHFKDRGAALRVAVDAATE